MFHTHLFLEARDAVSISHSIRRERAAAKAQHTSTSLQEGRPDTKPPESQVQTDGCAAAGSVVTLSLSGDIVQED